jgi:ribosome-binding factor A
MAERRPERVAHLVQAELAAWFHRDAKDPRLQDLMVTSVRMTPDLRVAFVAVRKLASHGEPPGTLKALARAGAALRGSLARRLGLRITPELRFAWDETPDVVDRLETLLRGGQTPSGDDDEESS